MNCLVVANFFKLPIVFSRFEEDAAATEVVNGVGADGITIRTISRDSVSSVQADEVETEVFNDGSNMERGSPVNDVEGV